MAGEEVPAGKKTQSSNWASKVVPFDEDAASIGKATEATPKQKGSDPGDDEVSPQHSATGEVQPMAPSETDGSVMADSTTAEWSVAEALQEAKELGRRRLRKLRGPTLLLGSMLTIIGVLSYLRYNTSTDQDDSGESLVAVVAIRSVGILSINLGVAVLYLSLSPADNRCVKVVAGISIPCCFLWGLTFLVGPEGLRRYDLQECSVVDASDQLTGKDLPCWMILWWAFIFLQYGMLLIVIGIRYCVLLCQGADAAKLINSTWQIARPFYWSGSLSLMSAILAINHVDSTAQTALCISFANGICYFVIGLACSHSNVTRVQSWLMSRGESATAAAAVSSLLGASDVEHVLARARKTFLCVSAEKLTQEDLANSTPDASLAVHTHKARLGEADGFMSHSWHDDPAAKWLALQEWREHFKKASGKEPVLWIDKYCVDQDMVDESLSCLPVYLAGCRKLLVLCGATHLDRLWCVVEIFIFLQMGGKVSDIDVLFLEGRGEEPAFLYRSSLGGTVHRAETALEATVRQFRVQEARCFNDYDTQRLQAVMEAAGKDGTNMIELFVRSTFVQSDVNRQAWKLRPSLLDSVIQEHDGGRNEELDLPVRIALLDEAKALGDKDGAEKLHTLMPPLYWGVSKRQFQAFVHEVRACVDSGMLTNSTPMHLPNYPEARFAKYGPNMHQVNNQFIKPCTDGNARTLPFASYALQKNDHAGCECELFVSHAWDEGIFQFGSSLVADWPDTCNGAYICFLANPQNLSVAALVSTPKDSPFYRVLLSQPTEVLMVSNPNIPIHSRLWCVFEAHCARSMGIPTRIAGDPLWLVEEAHRADALEIMQEFAERKLLGRDLEQKIATLAVDVQDAECFSEQDREKILKDIGQQSGNINVMIKEQMLASFAQRSCVPGMPGL